MSYNKEAKLKNFEWMSEELIKIASNKNLSLIDELKQVKSLKEEYFNLKAAIEQESAKGVPGSLFNAETAPAVVEQLKSGIKAPYVNAQVASLGGPENVSVIFTVSADPKESWSNGILENSRYGKFYLHNDGEVEQFSGGFGKFKEPLNAVRKRNVKSVDQLIQVINNHVAQVQATPKVASLKKNAFYLRRKLEQGENPYLIKPEDVGEYFDMDFGQIQSSDVGKLVYLRNGIVQMENDEQKAKREMSASLKTAIKINVFNKVWEAIPTTKEGKLSYEISDGKNKLLSISPLNNKEMNAEHLKWAAERELTSNYKKATLIEKVAFLPEGTKGYVLAQDKAKKRVKLAFLEQNVRAWVPEGKIKIEALESQSVQHSGHSDKVLGSTATETLLDCVEGGPIWVNSTELLDANHPPATPEALNPIEEEASKESHREWAVRLDGHKIVSTHATEAEAIKALDAIPSSYFVTGDVVYRDIPENEKQSSKDCPDCHGNFAGKEDEKCPTCGRFSVKEAAVGMCVCGHTKYSHEFAHGKTSSCAANLCKCNEYKEIKKEAAISCPYCQARIHDRQAPNCEECGKPLDKESLKTALPPTIPNQRGYLDNPPVEKKAEIVDAEELELYTENERDLHDSFMSNIEIIKEMLRDGTYDYKQACQYWVEWYTQGAQKYQREFPGSKISPSAIQQAAARQEPYVKQQVENGEYGEVKAPVQKGLDINKLPVMNVEQEKDKLIDQLAIETDPEKKKSLERRYKHLTMASLKQSEMIDAARCPACNGVGAVMGKLGNKEYFRCMECGMDFSTNKPASLDKVAHIKHEDGKWVVYSHDYSKKLGTYPTKEKALKRLRQIEYFKNASARPFSKKASEVMIDPYQALISQVESMRGRMADVQQRLESNPLPKTAGADEKDNSEIDMSSLFEDLTMGIDLIESKAKDEMTPELHENLESLENLLWEAEMKLGLTPKLSEEEKAEPEHSEIKEEIEEKEEVEASEKGRKPRSLVHKEYKDELTKEELEDEPVEKEAQAPNPAMGTPVAPAPAARPTQPTDEDNLEVPTVKPTSPPAPGQVWVWDAANKKYVSMPDSNAPAGQTI